MENLQEMKKFLDSYNLPKLNKDTDNLNKHIASNEIKAVIKSFPSRPRLGPDGFTTGFYKTFKEEVNSNTLRTIPKYLTAWNSAELFNKQRFSTKY